MQGHSFKYDFKSQKTSFFHNSELISHVPREVRELLESQKISFIHNDGLPERIYSVTHNKNQIFVAGKGLTVYDKNTNLWKRWKEFDGFVIYEIEASDSQIWMGTEQGVIEVDLTSGKKTFYTESDGLSSNNIYSLIVLDSILLVGTYRYGTGKEPEWKDDIFGLGLDKINLNTHKISKISLPQLENLYHLNTNWLVIDMYPLMNEDSVRLVLWYPWKVKCFDYDYVNNKFKHCKSCEHHFQSILNTYGETESSELAKHLIEFTLKMGLNKWCGGGLPNPIAFETIQLIYKRGELKKIECLLHDPDPYVRTQTIWQIAKIDDPVIKSYLLRQLKEETNPYVKKELERCLERTKNR